MTSQRKEVLSATHVDVLDGVRGLAVLIVVWYHLWQQSWLMPIFHTQALSVIGIRSINLDRIPRTGYLLVDLMLLLSAFCLFLPHARTMLLDEPIPDYRQFYQKRAARIVPSYVLCVLLIFFGWCLPNRVYGSTMSAVKDVLMNLTFTMNFSTATYIGSKINAVLWTAAVEMQFYLIFPLLAAAFRKKPFFTWTIMVLIGEVYLRLNAALAPDTLRMTLNQMIGFFSVFANGFFGAWVYVLITRHIKRNWSVSVPATIMFIACLWVFSHVEASAASAAQVQVFQAENRFLLSLLFLTMMLSLSLALRPLRFLFTNRIAVFFGTISYNLYLWHQWLAIRLKEWHIPYWTGDIPPNQAGNFTWQWQYMLLCSLAAIVAACLATYLVEKPLHTLLLQRSKKRNNA